MKKAKQTPDASTAAAAAIWEHEARGLRRIPVFMGLAVLLVGGYAMAQGGEDPEGAEQSAPDEAPEPAPEQPAAEQTPPEDPAPEPAATPEEVEDAPSGAEASDEPAPEGEAGADEPEPAPAKTRASARKAPRKARPAAVPAPAPAPAKSNDERIAQALEEGWMREGGGLLLVFPKNKQMSWDDAAKLCRRSKAGVSGWRLPTVSQLKSLRKANVLPMGTWWSSTDAGDASKAMALTTSKSDASEATKAEAGGQPVCVRKR